jgi:carbon-monoxide dehydrogenase small subunit
VHGIKVTVNGTELEHEVEPNLLLVHFLREKMRQTGTHVGCDTGNCGACSILLNGKLIKSCMMLAVQADGSEIMTIEGLAQLAAGPRGLHPIQQAFLEKFASQCGYCTPGMILSAYALLSNNSSPSDLEIRDALEGNICMCTGYQQIIEAIEYASQLLKDSV